MNMRRWWQATGVLAGVPFFLAAVARAEDPAPAPPEAVAPAPVYETTVTALRLPRPLRDVPSTVTVLSREEIDRTPALAADGLLRAVPSVGTFRRTPSLVADPTAQGLNLRGVGPSGVSRALVLMDGIPINDPFGGWIYWRSLPRLGLDRIEIAPGGTSALYGNYGLGGVVGFLSRPIDDRIDAEVATGSLHTTTGAVRAAGHVGRVGAVIEGEGLTSDGYVPVTPRLRGAIDRAAASRHLTANGRVEVAATPALKLTARAAVFGENENGGTTYTTAQVRTTNYSVGLLADPDGGPGRLQLTVFGSVERFRQGRARIAMDRSTEEQSARQEVPSHGEGASVTAASRRLSLGGTHELVAGVDARQVTGTSDETLLPVATAPGTALVGRRAEGSQQFAGVFAQDAYDPTSYLTVLGALRVDLWRNSSASRDLTRKDGTTGATPFSDRHDTAITPRLGFLLRPLPRMRVRALGYQSFRAPTLNELYRPFQVGTILTAANENLRSERLIGGELGVEGLFGQASTIRLTGFWNVLIDPIANVTLPMALPDGSMRQRQNLGRVTIRGVEASADLRLGRHVWTLLSYTAADSRVSEAPDHPELIGKKLAHDPVHRGRAAVAVSYGRFEATLQARAQSRLFEDDQNMLPMDGFVVVDAFARVALGWHTELYATAENLLDHRYTVGRTGIDTIGPPLIALAGLRVR